MKNLKVFLYLFIVTGLLLVSCSKDSNEDMEATVNESISKETTTSTTNTSERRLALDLVEVENKLIATAERQRKTATATSRSDDWIPGIVKSKIARKFPDATIISKEAFTSIPDYNYKHYSVMLDNGMELVYFESGALLAEATIEEAYGENELKAGELSWGILMYLYYRMEDEIIEEAIVGTKENLRQLDYMDKSRMILKTDGGLISTGVDRQGDDEGKITVNGEGETTTTSSSFDDDDNGGVNDIDDDGPGDNDDGDGDNDDGVAGNQDDDDDGLGDNDDGIAGNQDDDDNGNNDNDDGVAGNSGPDDDDDGLGDDDDGVAGNQDDDDNGNGDNDDGIAGNSNHIDPTTLPVTVRNYIATNYPTATIIQAEQYATRYEVKLNNGVELYFNLNGNLIGTSGSGSSDDDDDDGNNGGSSSNNNIDPATLPVTIRNYISTNYPTATIIQAEQYTTRYEVNLNNGVELYFNLNGNLIGTSGNGSGDDDDDGNNGGGNDNDDDDDGISGNDDDDDGYTGGISDDDDDGLGDNDDGIAGNQDDDDNGNGDNDDGVAGNGNNINPATLPATIQNYIASNYPTATIVQAEQYANRYEVNLNSGIELYFDLNGNLISSSSSGSGDDDDDGLGDNDDGIAGNQDNDDNGNGDNDDGVTGNGNNINPATLPATIQNYIATNYSTATIVKAEQYTNRYEVDLNNGIELYFDLNGNLIGTSGSSNGDDDDDGNGGSNDNDDDDDGINGNDDDDDGTIGGTSDDDDDGLGDNDDGIAGNQDDDDNGNGDNDDGVSGNGLDDDDDGLGDNDDGIAGNQDNDDNGNGDNDDGVSGNGSNINPATLPAAIQNYIATNYPTATIIKAEQYTNRYEVNLNNGVELYFDLNGNLIGTSGGNSGDDDDDGAGNDDDDN